MSLPFVDRTATLKVRPSVPDHRDRWLFATPAAPLPASATLGVTVPIKDQGRQGSCTGHGYSSMYEAAIALTGVKLPDRSRAFIYACERILEHDINQDAGASPIDGCKTLKHRGVCAEMEMPYNDTVFSVAPTAVQLSAALPHRITGYARVLGVDGAKQATVDKKPIGFGIAVYDSFEHIGASGVMPMPDPKESMLGGHWVFGNAGGYQDDPSFPGGGYFVAQNSWGASWGKSGYFLIPYAYLAARDYTFEVRAIWL